MPSFSHLRPLSPIFTCCHPGAPHPSELLPFTRRDSNSHIDLFVGNAAALALLSSPISYHHDPVFSPLGHAESDHIPLSTSLRFSAKSPPLSSQVVWHLSHLVSNPSPFASATRSLSLHWFRWRSSLLTSSPPLLPADLVSLLWNGLIYVLRSAGQATVGRHACCLLP